MPRRKPPRWSLGAPALVALAVAGCGAAANQPKLHNSSEQRLLSMVSRARLDAAKHNGIAVQATLGEFVSQIKTLKTAGQLSDGTAGRLDREAHATAAQAARQLRPTANPANTNATGTTIQPAGTTTEPAGTTTQPAGTTTEPAGTTTQPAGTTTQPAGPAATTSPAAGSMPRAQDDSQSATTHEQARGDQNGSCSNSEWSGQGPGHGHGYGHDGWLGCGQGDGSQSGSSQGVAAAAWAKLWRYWTGGGGD